MKIKIIITSIIAIFIMLLAAKVFAATGTVKFEANTTEVEKGKEITITLSANSEDGINGIDTQYTYDSEKLELVSESVVDTTNWSNVGTTPNITLICNAKETIKQADLYIIKFKVKDSVSAGDKIIIETTNILLDTDAKTDSDVNIPSKKIEVTVKEASKDDSNENKQPSSESENNQNEDKQSSNENKQSSKESENSQNENMPAKTDKTYASGVLPKTGKNYIIITIFLIITIVLAIIFYKKYMQHKDIN